MATALLQCLESPQPSTGEQPQGSMPIPEKQIGNEMITIRPSDRRTQSLPSMEAESSQSMVSLSALRHVEIPQAPGLQEEGSNSQALSTQAGPRVLLVDDNDINLRLLQTFSKRLGIPSEPAQNGLIALEAYKAAWDTPKPFQYVLLDLSMPVMDGFEACREIRNFEQERNAAMRKERRLSYDQQVPKAVLESTSAGLDEARKAKIIALTGLNSAASQQEAFASGMDLFLTKPVKFQELRKLVLEKSLET